jgi:hypothetical protein
VVGLMPRTRRWASLTTQLGLCATLHASIATTLVIATTEVAHAQKTALSTQKLIDQAREKFDDQQYDESIQKLSAALLRQDITPAQKTEVYRWLAYNYIVLKQDDAAKTALYALYAVDEDYALPDKESPKFREPFTKYKQAWIDDGKPGKPKAAEKPPTPVTIKHLPLAQVPHDRSFVVKGSLDDADGRTKRIAVLYRTGASGKFTEAAATLDDAGFQFTIPASAVKPPIVEYYVEAFDKGGLPIAGRGDADLPLRVVVQGEQSGSVFGEWWFWSIVGVAVAGGVVGAYFATQQKNGGTSGPTNAGFTVVLK